MGNTPNIRFKGFTDDWEQRKFANITMRESTVGVSSSTYPSVEYEDVIAGEGRLNKDIKYKEQQKTGIVFNGTQILYGKLRPYLHNWLNPDFSGIAVGDWWVLKPVETDKSFIYRLIQTQQFDDVANQSAGSKMPRADWNLVSNTEFRIPKTSEEQMAIGTYFSNLDHLITLHQRKCDETKKLKKFMLQKMFPKKDAKKPEIRFAGFTNDWEQRKLGEIVERVTRKNQDLVSELPLTISAQYGLIDQNEFFDKRVASKDVSGYYLIYNGEFAYNKSTSSDAPWGAIKRLDRYENGVLSTLYIVFRIKNEDILNSDFLMNYYDTNNWHKDIQAIAAEGARNHGLLNIAPADFFETELMLPQDIEEQKNIGNYFKSLNNLITLHQRKCDELKEFKKYMLQNMFPQKG